MKKKFYLYLLMMILGYFSAVPILNASTKLLADSLLTLIEDMRVKSHSGKFSLTPKKHFPEIKCGLEE